MSKQVVAVIPDDVRVSTSTQMSQVILTFEILLDAEVPGDPQAEQKYLLNLDLAERVAKDLLRQSQRLRDSLGELPRKVPGNGGEPPPSVQ